MPSHLTHIEAPHVEPDPGMDGWVLHVDGADGCLVLTGARVTIGAAVAGSVFDLAILAAPETPIAQLQRIDEDYFLSAEQPIRCNGELVRRILLRHGDRVALSTRATFRFHRPTEASTSAVLELGGTRLARGDVQRVVMIDHEMLLGDGPWAHHRVPRLARLVMRRRPDGLTLMSPATVGGRAWPADTVLPVGRRIAPTPGLTLVLEPWRGGAAS